MSELGRQRREVLFAGQVQGVGFRYTTRNIARRFPVTGFVENLRDGRVRLLAEGEPGDVEQFIGAVAAEMDGYIDRQQSTAGPATGEFAKFEVRT